MGKTTETTDFRTIIRQIMVHGRLRHVDIAAECGCTENHISRLACGCAKTTYYDLGRRIVDLHERVAKKPTP